MKDITSKEINDLIIGYSAFEFSEEEPSLFVVKVGYKI